MLQQFTQVLKKAKQKASSMAYLEPVRSPVAHARRNDDDGQHVLSRVSYNKINKGVKTTGQGEECRFTLTDMQNYYRIQHAVACIDTAIMPST